MVTPTAPFNLILPAKTLPYRVEPCVDVTQSKSYDTALAVAHELVPYPMPILHLNNPTLTVTVMTLPLR